MSMSDCEKCWDTPCTCGWDYRKYSKEHLIEMRDMFQQLIDGTHQYSNVEMVEPKNVLTEKLLAEHREKLEKVK